MKTFSELETIGIIEKYTSDHSLYIITKDGNMWRYDSMIEKFNLVETKTN